MEKSGKTKNRPFQPEDLVSYGTFGVCKILCEEYCNFDEEHEENYWKLRPLDNNRSVYYVPVRTAQSKLRRLLTKEEIYDIIDDMADAGVIKWSNDSRERKGVFRDILQSNDYRQIFVMMHTIHLQQEKRRSAGRKLAAVDEGALHAAETRVYQEFGIVLHLEPSKVHEFIIERISAGQGK